MKQIQKYIAVCLALFLGPGCLSTRLATANRQYRSIVTEMRSDHTVFSGMYLGASCDHGIEYFNYEFAGVLAGDTQRCVHISVPTGNLCNGNKREYVDDNRSIYTVQISETDHISKSQISAYLFMYPTELAYQARGDPRQSAIELAPEHKWTNESIIRAIFIWPQVDEYARGIKLDHQVFNSPTNRIDRTFSSISGDVHWEQRSRPTYYARKGSEIVLTAVDYCVVIAIGLPVFALALPGSIIFIPPWTHFDAVEDWQRTELKSLGLMVELPSGARVQEDTTVTHDHPFSSATADGIYWRRPWTSVGYVMVNGWSSYQLLEVSFSRLTPAQYALVAGSLIKPAGSYFPPPIQPVMNEVVEAQSAVDRYGRPYKHIAFRKDWQLPSGDIIVSYAILDLPDWVDAPVDDARKCAYRILNSMTDSVP